MEFNADSYKLQMTQLLISFVADEKYKVKYLYCLFRYITIAEAFSQLSELNDRAGFGRKTSCLRQKNINVLAVFAVRHHIL